MARKKTVASTPTDPVELITSQLSEILLVQKEIAKSLERLEKKMDNSNDAQTAFFKNISGNIGRVIKNQSVFYTKFLLTRLNLIELSEGRPVSVSRNEEAELENSKRANPDSRIASLPPLSEVKSFEKKWAH